MNFLISSKPDVNFDLLQSEKGEAINRECLAGWNVYSEKDIKDIIEKYPSFFSLVDGYIRNLNEPVNDLIAQIESCLKMIENTWPVPQNITGSFSSVLVNSSTKELVLCTDLIGIYPLYYLNHNGHLYISNSIIWIGIAAKVGVDETGVFQRSFGPEFCNLGRRTILKNCKRLLPGEWLKFNAAGELIETKYDKTLYNNVSIRKTSTKLINEYWNGLKNELKYCLGGKQEVNLALSGGMDSRILLGAVPSEKHLSCLTYGADENYETRIAGELARIKGAAFKNFHKPSLNFPSLETLKEYTLKTEGVHLCSWLEILENVPDNKEVLLIGDISTAATGRTIKRFNSKTYQKRNFLKHTLLNKEYSLEPNTPETFKRWKEEITGKFIRFYTSGNINALGLEVKMENLRNDLLDDLSILFERIESHKFPYIELVDELFTWYTHTRLSMGKQVLINNSKFRAYCPGLSIAVIRKASNIPPNLRLNQKFVRKLFREVEELKTFGRTPTSQIPLIPQNFSDLIRFPVWGIRSKLDDYLIKRMMKARNPKMRYRLFPSNNWVEVYQNPDMEKNLNDYFKNDYLGQEYVKGIKIQATMRRDLKQWPFANMNIINAAALNAELELIASYRKRDEV